MVISVWNTHVKYFGSILISKVQRKYFTILILSNGLWYNHFQNIGSVSQIWKCKGHLCTLSLQLSVWRMLEVPPWSLASWSWFGYHQWSLIQSCSKFWLSILNLKAQKSFMFFKSSFGTLEAAGASWLDLVYFVILILIWIRSQVYDILNITSFVLYLDSEGAKNIHVL